MTGRACKHLDDPRPAGGRAPGGPRVGQTEVIDLVGDPDASLLPALDCLDRHGILAYPTETVYGLGSLATPRGVSSLAAAKSRPPDRPFIVLVGSKAQADSLAWNSAAERLVERFWPGPLTIVLGDPDRSFPPGVRSVEGGVAVRLSPDPAVRRLLDELGEPVTSTSANLPGESPALTAASAVETLRRIGVVGGCVIDGGARVDTAPSTLVTCTTPAPRILREGAVPKPLILDLF